MRFSTDKTLTQRLDAGSSLLWLDFYDYAGALFGGAAGVPWLEDAAFAAFHAKAQALLRPDVLALPAEPVATALLGARPELAAALKAKSRPGYPLRRLLEEDSLRRAVEALLVPLRAAAAGRPLALALPSPRHWLALAYRAAHGVPLAPEVAADGDEIDGAAVYVADFLREFSGAGVDVLLLCEAAEGGPGDAAALALYEPVVRSARHYRWEAGLLDPAGILPAAEAAALDFLITSRADATVRGGTILPSAFWYGGAFSAARGQLCYGEIPRGAVPETVLECLASLPRQA